MTCNSKTRTGTTAPSRTGGSILNNSKVLDQMVRPLFAMISTDQRIYQKDHTISETVSMTQLRELFANMTESSSVILSQARSSGHQKSADTTQGNSRTMSTWMDLRTKSSKK